jgi:hypothetical protein
LTVCEWFDLKTTLTGFTGLASKPMATVSDGLTSKPAATVFAGLALKPVVTVSSGLTSKPAATGFASLALNQWRRFLAVWPQNLLRRFLAV